LKIEGFYPFPFAPAFHIFASVDLALRRRATVTNPILLKQTADSVVITDPSVFLQPIDQPNRDRYRVGIGIDILELIKSGVKGNADLKKKVDSLQSTINQIQQEQKKSPSLQNR
jgi:hypothetical protein